jgi:hypothetical protein
MSASIEPSIHETAFSCPHCSAFTTQHWFGTYAKEITGDKPITFVPTEKHRQFLQEQETTAKERERLLEWVERIQTGLVLLDPEGNKYPDYRVDNLHLSKCYNCKKIAVWVHDRLLFPTAKSGVIPNSDMPETVLHDFEEAREIVNASPRGSAALLRLCVQKLCKELGEKGRNIDDDIAALVKKGLNPLVQQSLDIVRVIGNEAVHPGVIDLKDDREIALRLFELVNAIADQMISHPKSVKEMYAKLPESKRKAIEARDAKSSGP